MFDLWEKKEKKKLPSFIRIDLIPLPLNLYFDKKNLCRVTDCPSGLLQTPLPGIILVRAPYKLRGLPSVPILYNRNNDHTLEYGHYEGSGGPERVISFQFNHA